MLSKKTSVSAPNIPEENALASMDTGLKEERITVTIDEDKAPDVLLLADHFNDSFRNPSLRSKLHGFD